LNTGAAVSRVSRGADVSGGLGAEVPGGSGADAMETRE
jgi:hypothetical protein